MDSLNNYKSTQIILSNDSTLNKDDQTTTQIIDNQLIAKDSNNDMSPSILGLNISNNFLNQLNETSTSNEEVNNNNLDLSILDKIRQRLLGSTSNDTTNLNDTQPINNEDTQKIDETPQSKSSFQLLPQLEVEESEYQVNQPTQITSKKSDVQPTQILETTKDSQPLTQLIDSHNTVSTQVIDSDNPNSDSNTKKSDLNDLFISDESDNDDSSNQPLTKEERLKRITELAEQKRKERLAKEQEEELLNKDLTKGSLTDEEDDLNNEANDTVVSSHMKNDGLSTKDLEKAQEFLNIQKRQIDIRPDFERKQVFTKDKFLNLFSDSEDDDEIDIEFNKTKNPANSNLLKPSSPVQDFIKSSPTTSPIKDDVYDLFKAPSKTQTKNPLELYAQRLKQNLGSSPTTTSKVINLDSDSDIEIGNSSSPIKSTTQYKTKISNHAKELNKIPELSKEQKFLIKQKFMKKKYQGTKQLKSKDLDLKNKQHKEFLKSLHKRNLDQLKTNRLNDHEYQVLEEFEKEEESLSSLLEREMERNRNIRKKEKLQERAKLALLGKKLGMKMVDSDGEEEYQEDDNEVADSDVPESDYDSGDYNDQSGVDISNKSENEDQGLEDQEKEDHSDNMNPNQFDDDHHFIESLHPKDGEDSFMSAQSEVDLKGQLPNFKDLTQSQTQHETQFDAPTQVDTSLLNIDNANDLAETQIIKQETDKVNNYYDDEDDDIITPANVKKGRKSLHNRMTKIKQEQHSDIEEENEDEDDPEVIQRKIKEYEQRIRMKELKARKRRKEMERKGLKTMLDGEAEESEDEWKGLGGIDGEFSDVANSEDEKMIDNDFNIDLQNDEIRQKFMEEYQIKDQKELEKLLDDIKNHKLIKRVGQNNGLDIELSDEEDQLLSAYRKQKLIEQQARLLQNKKLQELSKNEKSKAFFDTIQDKHEVIKIDSDSSDDDGDVEEIANPFKNDEENENTENEEADSLEKEEPIKKTIKIEESFVQNKLSFLNYSIYDDDDESSYQRIQKMSNHQYGISEDEEDVVDIKALRSKSSLNQCQLVTIESVEEINNKRKLDQDQETDIDSDDNEFLPIFKKPSITKSFKSFHEQQGDSFKNGKQHFTGVTISRQYKVVSGSKASITYNLSKNNNTKKIKSLKEQRIEKNLRSSSNHSSIFSNSEF
ncbi:hypothetical protein KGF54_004682 [Candida jiufengensis]|uniref:uncharacterized protein n=1 Tax=Candida jiufengensis TaxID=497108 RepID=UPI0022258900|nr:uncharacterized protein KGF54_004682 [Candida jiufengensis]KAI5951608.1 hypothetical protein KGF54_004682 [Candida jiufengensis]